MDEINKIWPKWIGVEVLGQGGFGTVYKVKRKNFGEESYAAIKVVKIPSNRSEVKEMTSSGLSQEQIKEYYKKSVISFEDEIKMMSKFKTASHIVGIEDFEIVDNEDGIGGTIYIRMELLKNISDHFNAINIDHKEVVKMAIDVLTALEFCHKQNVIHRDIKPGNIFISEFGEYKLGDFGISRYVEKTNATMSQKGTKSYMAPEMHHMGKYGKNVDIYALGLTMYELLNHGRIPFLPPYPESFYPSDREEALVKRLAGEEFPSIDGIGELNDIIKKACHFDPNLRYINATQMKEDLNTWLSNRLLMESIVSDEIVDTSDIQKFVVDEETEGTESLFKNDKKIDFTEGIIPVVMDDNHVEEKVESFPEKTLEEDKQDVKEITEADDGKKEKDTPVVIQKKKRNMIYIALALLLVLVLGFGTLSMGDKTPVNNNDNHIVDNDNSSNNNQIVDNINDDQTDNDDTISNSQDNNNSNNILNSNQSDNNQNTSANNNTTNKPSTNTNSNTTTNKPTTNTETPSKPTTYTLGNYTNKTYSTVKKELENAGLKVSVTYIYNDNVDKDKIVVSSPSNTTVKLGSTVALTVSKGAASWSAYTDSLPSTITSDKYIIEEQIRYSYRDKETTTSTASSLSGWTQSGSSTSYSAYGEWSEWSKTSVSKSETREVETKEVAAVTHTEYRYWRWRNKNGAGIHWCEKLGLKYRPGSSWYKQYTSWSKTKKKDCGSPGRCSCCTGYRQYGEDEDNAYYYQETKTVTDASAYTAYRYRDRSKTITYSYYKWTNWSDYSPTKVNGSATKEVKTKIYYRYKEK